MDCDMATRRQPLIIGWLRPGLAAAALLVAVALAAFLALWKHAPDTALSDFWQDSYLWHVVRVSFWQALLSALLSVLPAIFLARALYRRRFPGRLMLLRLCAMTLILPVLVAVFGILSVYGRQGWLATLCRAFYWRICSLTCRWPPACCCSRWSRSPANSDNWRHNSVCAAGHFSVLLSGRGFVARSRRQLH